MCIVVNMYFQNKVTYIRDLGILSKKGGIASFLNVFYLLGGREPTTIERDV